MRKTPKKLRKNLMSKKNSNNKVLSGIPLLTSPAYKKSFQSLAESISGRKIEFKMINGMGCFTGFNEKYRIPLMNIDLEMFENNVFETSHYHIIAKGAILHECGHLLYSDFDIIGQNITYSQELNKECSELGNQWYNETDEDKKEELFEELKDRLVEYVYAVNMPRTLNALEDGSIEASMCERGKEDSGCISFLRDSSYEKYLKNKPEHLDNNDIPLDENEWNDNTIEGIIMEVCYLATLNYRKSVDLTILDALFTKKEVDEFKELGTYARFIAPTTEDRNNAARVILDKCKPILEKIALNLAEDYLKGVENAKERMDNMQNSANQYANNSSSSSSGSSGLPNSQPQPQQKSKYNLDLPDELKQKIQMPGENNSENSDSDDASNNGSASETENGNEGNRSTLKTQEEASQEAINNMNEVIRNAGKTYARQEEQQQVDNILNHPNVRTGESSCHRSHDLRIREYDELPFLQESNEGGVAKYLIQEKNLLPKVNDLSKKIKKVLMHRSQDEISKGRYDGAIDTSGLYRIKTDLQVFKKETQGQKTKVRFSILVDESGSMCGSGLSYAITGCWMLAKASQKLRIPFAVNGHKDYDGVIIEKYIDFKDSSKTQALDNLFKMQSSGCNRDGLAIFHSLRELVSHAKPDEELYFIILSDGQPSSSNYCGQEAIDDIRQIINTYKKHWGVHSIGIGIGDDFDYEETVGQIYDNAVVVSKPEDLPNEMFKVFKKIVKV